MGWAAGGWEEKGGAGCGGTVRRKEGWAAAGLGRNRRGWPRGDWKEKGGAACGTKYICRM